MLQNAQKAVLFVKKYKGPLAAEDAYVILGEYQGKFVVDNEGRIIHSNGHLSEQLREINHSNELQRVVISAS